MSNTYDVDAIIATPLTIKLGGKDHVINPFVVGEWFGTLEAQASLEQAATVGEQMTTTMELIVELSRGSITMEALNKLTLLQLRGLVDKLANYQGGQQASDQGNGKTG